MTLSELLTRWKAEDARLDRQIEIDQGGFDQVSKRTHIEQLRLLRERTTALEMALANEPHWYSCECQRCAEKSAALNQETVRTIGDARTNTTSGPSWQELAALPTAPPQEQDARTPAWRETAGNISMPRREATALLTGLDDLKAGRIQSLDSIDQELAASPPAQAQEPTLLERAVADRDARPWRYYRLEHDQMKKWLEKIADERDALRAALPPAHGCHAEKEK